MMGFLIVLFDRGKARDAKLASEIFKCIILDEDDAEPPLGALEEFGLDKAERILGEGRLVWPRGDHGEDGGHMPMITD